MQNSKKGFTLVELIIVIAIIATLSVIAVMTITEWIGKSRDTRRLADLGQIDKSLDIAYTKNGEMPMPDSYVNVTANGTVIGYQGKFCDTAVAKTSIKTTPKDPMDDTCYSYYINSDKNKFQIMGMLENDKKILSYNNIGEIPPLRFASVGMTQELSSRGAEAPDLIRGESRDLFNGVYAADYSKRYPRVKGEKLGILISSGTNQPIEDGGTAVDVVNTTSSYVAYFNDTSKTSGTGLTLFSSIYVNSPAINTNTGFASFDSGLVVYYDMESVTSTGGLMDLSKYVNHGSIAGTSLPIQSFLTDGVKGKSFNCNGNSSTARISVPDSESWNLSGKNYTFSFWAKFDSILSGTYPILFAQYQGAGDFMQFYFENRANNNNVGFRFGQSVASAYRELTEGINKSKEYSTNTWYHIVFVRNGTNWDIYRNGVKQTRGTNSIGEFSNYSPVIGICGMIGSVDTNGYFYGSLDEIRVYNRALSDSEIQSLYNIK